ncbi:MAG: amidohydrolase family protein [Candidatus Tenebribacter mawsonii]|nr:amidohydrolase family protein [Candidatus Tenebribacter mawsonii]
MKIIKNAFILKSKKAQVFDILFDDKIIKIAKSIKVEPDIEVIDLHGKLLIPGCIDAHVHFNDPGFTDREDFTTGTTAAAFGGITTIIDMPCTSTPAVTNYENLHKKLNVISSKAIVDFALWGGIRKNDFPIDYKMIMKLWQSGVVGFKIYTISGMETFTALSYKDIENVFKKFPEILFAFHAEDESVINNSMNIFTNEQLKLPENYVKTRPVKAETTAVKKIISSVGKKNKVHFVHISSKNAAKLILESKEKFNVSFESCPQYLQFTSSDFPSLKGKLKTAPPVKFEEDKDYLRNCLKNGTLDFVTTDHAGCDYKKGKVFDDFSKVYNGIPGTELMIPYLFSEFYLKEKVSLKRMIELTSENAAKRYGLFPKKGSLQVGTDADFTIIDLSKPYLVDESDLHSIGKYSPFHETELACSIDKTVVRGNIVFDTEKGILQEPGYGKFISRS